MGLEDELRQIDWGRLMREWRSFEPDSLFRDLDPAPFVRSLVKPLPRFVEAFLAAKKEADKDMVIRDLYAYLLDKRYFERLNLLHFAFCVFDDNSSLPKDIIDRTPFPHEEGIPNFRHSLDP